jgi:hypothetical protein
VSCSVSRAVLWRSDSRLNSVLERVCLRDVSVVVAEVKA